MCGRYVLYDRLTNGNVMLLGHTISANFNVATTPLCLLCGVMLRHIDKN